MKFGALEVTETDVKKNGVSVATGAGGITQLTGPVTAGPGSGSVATSVANNAITDGMLRDSGALSVIGRTANSSGDPGDVSATPASDAVLRESGSVLGFGTIATGGIADNAVTNGKLRDSGALSVIGRTANSSGDPADVSATPASDAVLRESGSVLGFGTIATGGIANSAVTLAKQADLAQSTIIGRAVGAGTGVPTALTVAQVQAIVASLSGTVSGALIDVQAITATGAFTWTKPTTFTPRFVHVWAVGGGGGGGSGRRGATNTNRGGGGGGGSGAGNYAIYPAWALGTTETGSVGVGGTGAAAITADSTNGGNGNNGGDSSFGTATNISMTAGGGLGGGGGTTAGGGHGTAGTVAGRSVTDYGTSGTDGTDGTIGTTPTSPAAGNPSGNFMVGGAGPGCGGAGISNVNATAAGNTGGAAPALSSTVPAAGTAGSGSTAGGNGGSVPTNAPSGGAGGGGGASNGTGRNGGDGGLYGGGGAGGGASLNGTNSGKGGDGKPGIVVIVSMG